MRPERPELLTTSVGEEERHTTYLQIDTSPLRCPSANSDRSLALPGAGPDQATAVRERSDGTNCPCVCSIAWREMVEKVGHENAQVEVQRIGGDRRGEGISTEVRHIRKLFFISRKQRREMRGSRRNVPVDWQRSNAATISRRIGCVCTFCLVSARAQQHRQLSACHQRPDSSGFCMTPRPRFFLFVCPAKQKEDRKKRGKETYDPARFPGRVRWSSRQSVQSPEEDGA